MCHSERQSTACHCEEAERREDDEAILTKFICHFLVYDQTMRYRSILLIEKQYLIFNLSFDLVQIASEAAFPRNDRLVIKKASLEEGRSAPARSATSVGTNF